MIEEAKAHLGMGGRRRRYVNVEDVKDLSEVSDPSTTTDETATSIRSWMARHKIATLAIAVLSIILTVIVAVWFSKFVPWVLTNRWVHLGVAAVGATVYGYRRGWDARRTHVEEHDELTLKMGDDSVTMKGSFVPLPGESDAFLPIKGWRRAGHSPRPYKVAELSAAMAQNYHSRTGSTDNDNAAVVRLHPQADPSVEQTDWGRKIVQETGGLQPDPKGRETNLVATIPEYDDEEMDALAQELIDTKEENRELRQELDGAQRRVMNLIDKINEPVEELLEGRMDDYKDFLAIQNGHQQQNEDGSIGPRPSRDFRGTGSAAGSDELDDVEDEVSEDDDD